MLLPQGKMAVKDPGDRTARNGPGAWPAEKELTMDDVTWLPVPGAQKYEVSNHGRVRSVDRWVTYKDGRKPRHFPSVELRLALNPHGYRYITITTDSGRRTCRVHRLVCAAFHGPSPIPGLLVRHLNDVKTDNRAENLAWGTKSENAYDSIKHGTHAETNKTQCKQGHVFDEANTRWTNTGRNGARRRQCRQCMKESQKRTDAKRKDANREYQRRWYQENRVRIRARQHQHFVENREEVLASSRRRYHARKAGGSLLDVDLPEEGAA